MQKSSPPALQAGASLPSHVENTIDLCYPLFFFGMLCEISGASRVNVPIHPCSRWICSAKADQNRPRSVTTSALPLPSPSCPIHVSNLIVILPIRSVNRAQACGSAKPSWVGGYFLMQRAKSRVVSDRVAIVPIPTTCCSKESSLSFYKPLVRRLARR